MKTTVGSPDGERVPDLDLRAPTVLDRAESEVGRLKIRKGIADEPGGDHVSAPPGALGDSAHNEERHLGKSGRDPLYPAQARQVGRLRHTGHEDHGRPLREAEAAAQRRPLIRLHRTEYVGVGAVGDLEDAFLVEPVRVNECVSLVSANRKDEIGIIRGTTLEPFHETQPGASLRSDSDGHGH